MADPAYIPAYDTIALFRGANVADYSAVYIRGYNAASGPGGGFLRRLPAAQVVDDVIVFKNTAGNSYWIRDLEGGVVDAYMAGAAGGAKLNANGTIDTNTPDDTVPINNLLKSLVNYVYTRANSLNLSFRIGVGVFRVTESLLLSGFPSTVRAWVLDGTGATILGACEDQPILDLTDCRFGTVRNLQVIGGLDSNLKSICSCGIRIGRTADNKAANQMVMDHVGIRGSFKLAAFLNVASEQFTSINCEFSNEAEGPVYGYAGDAHNMLQWDRPLPLISISSQAAGTYTFKPINGFGVGDQFVVQDLSGGPAGLEMILFTVQSVGAATFVATSSASVLGEWEDGVIYKRRFFGPVDTLLLPPWKQNSFKQQYHLQCNYRAPRGIAAILEGCDSQHVMQAVHPTCGYYPANDPAHPPVAIASFTPGATTKVTTVATPPAGDGQIVSFSGIAGTFGDNLNDRAFKVAATSGNTFELRSPTGGLIDSSGWGGPPANSGLAALQKVAGGDDLQAGGFGMRMIVSTTSGCEISSYTLHHEPGDAQDEVSMTGETTWWGAIDTFEGLRDGAQSAVPVMLSDVTFAEPAAHGRGGFLLAKRESTSGVAMIGGKVTLTDTQTTFGTTGPANKLLMSSGTGTSLWSLTGTDLTLETAALVDVTSLAAFGGRLTARDAAFTAGVVANYPATLAVVQALTGVPVTAIGQSARLLDALLGTLERAGVLAKLDVLHLFAAGNAAAARINLANPSSGQLRLVGPLAGSTFTAWQGFMGAGGTTSYFQSPIGPSTQSQYQLNQASMLVVSRTGTGTAVSRDVSLSDTGGNPFAYIDPWSGAPPQFRSLANGASPDATPIAAITSPAGLFAWSRTGVGNYSKYFGAGATDVPSTVSVSSTATGTLPSAGFEVLRGGTHQVSAVAFGGKLTQTEMNALYSALKTYLVAVGAWV